MAYNGTYIVAATCHQEGNYSFHITTKSRAQATSRGGENSPVVTIRCLAHCPRGLIRLTFFTVGRRINSFKETDIMTLYISAFSKSSSIQIRHSYITRYQTEHHRYLGSNRNTILTLSISIQQVPSA